MTLDTAVQADILSTCNALGSEIKGIYEKGKDCIECLKDILRYLKRDSEDHQVLLFLGSIRLLQTDLLPIIQRYDKHKEIFDFTLRILVALTSPALLLYKEDLPDDKLSRNVYLQLIAHLQSYKKALTDTKVWEILYEHLKDLLKTKPIVRSSDENLLIERIIILIRNILHVPADDSVLKITDDDLSPHDKILQCLHESKINILLLYISANEEEHQYCLHIIEIVSLMLREHTPETLAKSNETRSTVEKEKDLSVLMAARQRELNLKMQKVQSMSTRRFNGVYCVKNMKTISNNDYIAHKFITNANDIKFDQMKDSRRKPKNRVRASDVENSRHSTLKIRLFLKKFCIEFLKTYNKLMVSIKRELLRKVSDEHDDSYYLWAISYFMEFNRLYDFQPALVSETISMQSFHYIQTQITNYQDMMVTDKTKAMFWAKRIQLGVSTYKELLETLMRMERSGDEIIKESADALISHVFYAIEYRELLWSLLSSYDEVKFPLSYLAKLVESSQLFLKMLESHAKKHSEIIVQKKQKKVRKKKKKKTIESKEPVNIHDQLNEQWDAVSSELSFAVQGLRRIPEVTPFDCASEMSFEDQKVEAVYKIREALISSEPLKAVGLLRAARELWPEGDSFGKPDVEPEPEFLILREIHFSNIQKNPGEEACPFVEEEESEENDEEMEAVPSFTEQKLDMDEIYKKYATHKVIKNCSLLLSNYQKNKPHTNLCLIKLLHRIAWNCKMHALFFQSTIFLTFQKIFNDPDVNSDPIIKEFYRFSKYIIQKFFEVAEKNNKIFVEFLFWKGPREAFELQEGYGTSSESKIKIWTEEEDEELRDLFEENKDICIEGQDVADIIVANLPSSRTKKQVIKALKRLGLINNTKELKPEQRKEWLETEIIELQDLFEDNKNSENVMACILDKLSIKRSRKAVTEKLLELNLVHDRKELRKKPSKRSKRSNGFDGSDASSDENDIFFNEDLPDYQVAAESSNDEDEENFFKNLNAERLADATEENSNNPLITTKVSSGDKSTNKVWEEQEIMMLTSLFHENHEADDIVKILTTALPKKRSKREIVDKLLELGLIKDKKEIKKEKSKIADPDLHGKRSNISQDLDKDSDEEENYVKVPSSKSKKNKKRQILDSSDEDGSSATSVLKDLNENKNIGMKQNVKRRNWSEEEVVALTQLYLEHKESENVLVTIIKYLPFKTTKKDILEKLLETGLIKDKNEVKNSISAKKKRLTTDVWEEHEVLELTQLFQNNTGSCDIMSDILQGLTVKRQKQKVVEKMLELGLIQDKKEIRKRKASKSGALLGKEKGKEKRSSKLNELSVNHNKRKVKTVSSDESDDDILPLSQMLSSKDDSENVFSSQSFSEISLQEKISTLTKSLKEVHANTKADHQDTGSTEVQNGKGVKTIKRKRHLIISDDSSDDDANVPTPVDDSEDVEILKNNPSEQYPNNLNAVKSVKKKMRILDDSDDSS